MTNHTCEQCNTVFKTNSALLRHKVIHSNAKPFVCTLCGKTFKLLGYLSSHMECHSNVADFNCDECDKSFKRKSDLKRHKLTVHSDVKSHICKECGKAFKQSGHLSTHMLTHSDGAEKFICRVCGGVFTRKDGARRHIRRDHTGITNPSSYIETTREKLDNGQVATCTTQTTVVSPGLAIAVSHITTTTASVRAISQEHPMVTVSTFTQQSPRVSASAGTQEGTPAPLVAHFHQEPDELNTDALLDLLVEHSTASIQTRFGCLDFNPLDPFDDIPT